MIRIGLTGGVACGKSTALKIFNELGCATISADDITHELMNTNKELIAKIQKTFNCVNEFGVVDRKKLGKLIFNEPMAKKKLEEMTHPLVKIVRKSFFQTAETKGNGIAVCETPLLFEKNLVAEFDYSVLIVAGLDVRIDRFIAKGKGTQEDFFNITKNQLLNDKKIAEADFVIKNNRSREELKSEIEKVIEQIRSKQQ